MKHHELDNQIPCVIENGIVYGLKDIYRMIRDMGHVRYSELLNAEVQSSGEGYIMSVVANTQSATIIANKRLYLNVCGFDYMTITTHTDGTVNFDLTNPYRILRLTPLSDSLHEDGSEEKPERFVEYNPLELENYAEIQLEEEDDLLDGD